MAFTRPRKHYYRLPNVSILWAFLQIQTDRDWENYKMASVTPTEGLCGVKITIALSPSFGWNRHSILFHLLLVLFLISCAWVLCPRLRSNHIMVCACYLELKPIKKKKDVFQDYERLTQIGGELFLLCAKLKKLSHDIACHYDSNAKQAKSKQHVTIFRK